MNVRFPPKADVGGERRPAPASMSSFDPKQTLTRLGWESMTAPAWS